MSADTGLDRRTAAVWTSPEGVPARLLWSGRQFIVLPRPIPWLDHQARAAGRDARAEAQSPTGRQMWQVRARAVDDGQILIFDLAVTAGPHWPVASIFD